VGCTEKAKTKKEKRKKERENPLERRKEERRKEKGRKEKGRKENTCVVVSRRRRREKTILPELGFLFVSVVGFSIVVRRSFFLCVSPLRQQVCVIFFRSRRCGFFG